MIGTRRFDKDSETCTSMDRWRLGVEACGCLSSIALRTTRIYIPHRRGLHAATHTELGESELSASIPQSRSFDQVVLKEGNADCGLLDGAALTVEVGTAESAQHMGRRATMSYPGVSSPCVSSPLRFANRPACCSPLSRGSSTITSQKRLHGDI